MNAIELGLTLASAASPAGPLQSTPPAGGQEANAAASFARGSDAFAEKPRVLLELSGEHAGDQFGWVARNIGDVDADGVDDFAATAPTYGGAQRAAGRVYVYSSKKGELLYTKTGQPGERLGNSVAGAFDANGDGAPDLIAGAPGSGRAYVYSGADGAGLLTLESEEAGDSFGLKSCGIEDIDGDGVDDLAVGAPQSDARGTDAGRVYLHSGRDGARLHTLEGELAGDQFGSSVDATTSGGHALLVVGAMGAGERRSGRAYVFRIFEDGPQLAFTVDGDETSANLGQYFVAIAGDMDGDGVPDIYASDWNNRAKGGNTGRVYVHSGETGERLVTLTGGTPNEGFGTSHSVCGDVDGDGASDLIVGAWQNAEGAPSGGKCYLYACPRGELLATYTCLQPGDTLGFDSVGLGDVDGDGATDFLVTSGWSAIDGPRQGRVFVVAGPSFAREPAGADSRD